MISHFLNMKERRLTDEILDSLPSDDPEALRSRRDLKIINFLIFYHYFHRTAIKDICI